MQCKHSPESCICTNHASEQSVDSRSMADKCGQLLVTQVCQRSPCTAKQLHLFQGCHALCCSFVGQVQSSPDDIDFFCSQLAAQTLCLAVKVHQCLQLTTPEQCLQYGRMDLAVLKTAARHIHLHHADTQTHSMHLMHMMPAEILTPRNHATDASVPENTQCS